MNTKLREDISNLLIELKDIGFKIDIFDIDINELDIYVYSKVHWWRDVSDYIITLNDYLIFNNIGTHKTFIQHNSDLEIDVNLQKDVLMSQTLIQLRK